MRVSEAKPGPFGPWPRKERRVAYSGRFQVVEDVLLTPDGEMLYTTVLAYADAVLVLALTADRKVILVRQYRPPVDKVTFELPGGAARWGEDPQANALRELEEETGYTAQTMVQLARVVPFGGSIAAHIYVFFARDLVPVERRIERERHEWVELVYMDFNEALQKALDGAFTDAALVLGLLMARQKGLA